MNTDDYDKVMISHLHRLLNLKKLKVIQRETTVVFTNEEKD